MPAQVPPGALHPLSSSKDTRRPASTSILVGETPKSLAVHFSTANASLLPVLLTGGTFRPLYCHLHNSRFVASSQLARVSAHQCLATHLVRSAALEGAPPGPSEYRPRRLQHLVGVQIARVGCGSELRVCVNISVLHLSHVHAPFRSNVS